MLVEIFNFYIQGLLLSSLTVVFVSSGWILYRAIRKKDKTSKDRLTILYEALLMNLVTIPILSFAFMAIILIVKA
ncbi:DUF4059 family protein [Streptococcus macacae]|uniref:Uncharacterized protein n=1 Tax=Streptococcus macacae NCTC 11558 TaxID=764298 RepID=G5JY09_9STRE|nr:DUF4059 family protein [Streptococcus macacae]EHJ52988.1 hypothetical protein STRMA_0055 [Streptococcus macacae NCTC 11558]